MPSDVSRVRTQATTKTIGDDVQGDRQDDPAVAEEGERLVEDLDPDAVGDQLGDAAARDHQDQRRDHRLDVAVCDEQPVPQSAQGRDA